LPNKIPDNIFIDTSSLDYLSVIGSLVLILFLWFFASHALQ
jgi:hypothetical protein